jgi:hypothetical protein
LRLVVLIDSRPDRVKASPHRVHPALQIPSTRQEASTMRTFLAVSARPTLVVLALLVLSTAAKATDARSAIRIRARSTNTHSVYVGIRDNWLTVDGDGTTDLDCWVYDADGDLVDSDTDDTDYCVLHTPGVGRHRLVVKNYGTAYNDYALRQREALR